MNTNKTTKRVNVGTVPVGAGAPVSIQSMLAVPAHDIKGNVSAAKVLEEAGCEILRVSVPDADAANRCAVKIRGQFGIFGIFFRIALAARHRRVRRDRGTAKDPARDRLRLLPGLPVFSRGPAGLKEI